MEQPLGGGELRHVVGDEQHLRHVGERIVIALVERQPARHAQQIVERDGAARVALAAPFGQQGRVGDRKLAVLHPEADQRVDRPLGHRPGDQLHVLIESRRVALGDDAPAVHHHQRPRIAGMGRVGLGEGGGHAGVERGQVDAVRGCTAIDALAVRPQRIGIGRRRRGQRRHGREVRGAAVDAGAAEPVADDRGLRRQAMERGGHALPAPVDLACGNSGAARSPDRSDPRPRPRPGRGRRRTPRRTESRRYSRSRPGPCRTPAGPPPPPRQ